MKLYVIILSCCTAYTIYSANTDHLASLIKSHDWQGVDLLINGPNAPIITDHYVNQAQLADCRAERKCWRSCACIVSPIIGFMASSYLNDNSYAATFINRAGSSAIAITAERLIIHGQLRNFYNARRILLLLQQRQINPV